jgi:NADH-quinone oxidoreductase subunit L
VNPTAPDRWAAKAGILYSTLMNKYYIDELYDFLFVEPTKKWGLALDWFDRVVLDGIVRGVGHMAEMGAAGSTWVEKHVIYGGINIVGYGNHLMARQWRQLQSGMVHHYAAIIVAGLFLLAVVIQLIVQR